MGIVLSVTQLNTYLKALLDSDDMLRGVFLRGEISGYKKNFSSGHVYFSLKEGNSAVSCVMFVREAMRLKFSPCDGMAVVAYGRVTVYERDGKCQLYVESMKPDGEGASRLALRKLYERLDGEGMFSEDKKRPVPVFPMKAIVITSASGAAVNDVFSIWKRRWPICCLDLFPVSVQGENAAPEICEAFAQVSSDISDVVILTRGGGSAEDLWAFNDERVVRAIAACPVPVISAVGHETDYTLSDLVASKRAATPSAAAEIAFPNSDDVEAAISSLFSNIRLCTQGLISSSEARLESNKPYRYLKGLYRDKNARFLSACAALEALSPLGVLLRGYCMADGGDRILSSTDEVRAAKRFSLRMHDGSVCCAVDEEDQNA